jgi:hypothetical protein
VTPASAPALAHLLGSSTLAELSIINVGHTLLDAPSATLLADALRANATLTALTLSRARVWSNTAAAAALLDALTGHASLRQLAITEDGFYLRMHEDKRRCAGALLGALVAVNSPTLLGVNLHYSGLDDDGLGPLFEALPGNTHLQELQCSDNDMSDAFARNVLLPAVRANASLRMLITHVRRDKLPSEAAREAEALVLRRPTPR